MAAVNFTGTIKNGKFIADNLKAWISHIATLEGSVIEVRVSKERQNKSSQANRYYWGVVIECARKGMEEMTGEQWHPEEAHDLLKQYCNAKELKAGLSSVKVGKTTKGMSKEEFALYIDRCVQWIYNTFNIVVPSSDDVYTDYR